MSPIIQIITAFTIGLILVYYSIPVIVRLSAAKKLFDLPNERKLNKRPIPNLGGVALFFGITMALLIAIQKNVFSDFRYVLTGMIILFFIGIKDDILVISARKKFIAQLVSALIIVVLGNIRVTNLHGVFGFHQINDEFSILISILAIVSIINALNLIDGIDGLAAALGIVVSVFFGFIFYSLKHFNYSILSFAITGSLLPFFFYNVFGQKNKIFMGDTGSLILGLLFSVFVIKFNEFTLTATDELRSFSPVLSLAVISIPLFDMIRLFVVRILQKKSPFSPDINHIHHKILKLNFSHLKSTLLLTGATLASTMIIFLLRKTSNNLQLFILILTTALISALPGFVYQYKKSKNSITKRNEISLFLFFWQQRKANSESQPVKKVSH